MDQDAIEGAPVGRNREPVPPNHGHAARFEGREPRTSFDDEGTKPLHGQHLPAEPRQNGGGVTGASTDLEGRGNRM